MSKIDRAAVMAYERHILTTEGPYHVRGAYYANADDAARQRRSEAARLVRETRRRVRREEMSPTANRPRLGTWLTPRERSRIDLVAGGQCVMTHRDTLHAIRSDLTIGRIDATLVSAALICLPEMSTLSGIVRDFPGTPVIGIVAEIEESRVLAGVLAFGQAGLQSIVDARSATGWSALRTTLAGQRPHDPFIQRAIRDLTGAQDSERERCSAGWSRFVIAAFSPRSSSAKQIGLSLGVGTSTLTSRFYRAGLPSPKRYIAFARLIWAARLGETPGLSIAAIAHRLDASSPQSFGRTVRTLVGITAAQFRDDFDGASMLARFRAELIEPYREALRTFNPLCSSVAERSRGRRAGSSACSHLGGRAA